MEDDDPLAQYRRPGARRTEKPAEPPLKAGRKRYQAFDAKDKLMSLDIRRVLGATHAPTYAYLLNVAHDHEYFTNFVLYYSFMQVKVRGKNLKDVITAIKLRKCEFIQDFHPGEHEPPKAGEPVIDSITVEWRGDPVWKDRDDDQEEPEKPVAAT